MMNLKQVTEIPFRLDIGQGSVFNGDYEIPYFFESPSQKMMHEPDYKCISFKAFTGVIFQFAVDYYHSHRCLLITSTLGDCAFIRPTDLSLEKAKAYAQREAEKKHIIKNSYSGYFSFGQKLLRQYDILEQHFAENKVHFSDDALKLIWEELCRRNKDE